MIKYKVNYGGHVYEQAGLCFGDLIRYGTTIQPKIAGLVSTVGAIISEKAVVNSEVFSFYQTIEKIFTPADWEYLFKMFLLNENNTLIIDGNAVTTEEVEEHFRGDLLRAYTVAIKLALKNLGESSPFTESLTGSWKNIMDFLSKVLKEKLGTIEDGLQKASKNTPNKQ
jgi:hypothetical protein